MDSLLNKVQREAAVWRDTNFPGHTADQQLFGIVEEVGELCHAHLKNSQNIRINEPHEEHMKDAIGDILIFLLGYCSKKGYDIEQILSETWEHVKKRNWVKYPETGRPPNVEHK